MDCDQLGSRLQIDAGAIVVDHFRTGNVADLAEADEFGLGPGRLGLGHGSKLQVTSHGRGQLVEIHFGAFMPRFTFN